MAQAGVQETKEESLSMGELRTLHLDLLRRPPFDAERKEFTSDVERQALYACGGPAPGRVDLAGKAKALVATREFWQQWLEEQLYFFLLVDNFAPRGESMLTIPDELAAGKLTVRDAIHKIALSSSFDQRNPGADTFVTVVMEQLAGLAVEKQRRELEIGKGAYDGKPGNFLGKPASSQSDVVRNAIEQRSFSESFLARDYRRYVHAAPDKREITPWINAFHADPKVYTELLLSWIASPQYKARLARREPMDNRLFVRALFVDLCQREPAPEEFSRLRSALDGLADPQPLRSVLARILLDSDQTTVPQRRDDIDPARFVKECFERLLARAPTDSEGATFAQCLADPAGKPSLVAYALVTHPEYQSY